MNVNLKVRSEWNWRGIGSLSVFRYTQMVKLNMNSVIPVPLETSILGVQEGLPLTHPSQTPRMEVSSGTGITLCTFNFSIWVYWKTEKLPIPHQFHSDRTF